MLSLACVLQTEELEALAMMQDATGDPSRLQQAVTCTQCTVSNWTQEFRAL